jgi:hypothetical protein
VTLSRLRPNVRLRALLDQARWPQEGLARAVNEVGAEVGLMLGYDRTAVAHWLSGTCPRGEVRALIVEALSRRLGRSLTVDDVGLAPIPAPVAATRQGLTGDPISTLLELTHADADPAGHARLCRTVYRLGAPAVLDWPTVADQARVEPAPDRGRGPIGMSHANAAHHMADVLGAADRRFGGGHARTALTAYLASDIVNWLRAPAPATVHHEMLAAAADLVLLAGVKCFDSEEHGLGQRYYLSALAVAARSADPVRCAVVLCAMSQQACHLAHYQQGLDLAGAALAATATHRAPPCTEASIHAQAGVCHAALGHLHTAMRYRDAAYLLVKQATDPQPVFGAYHAGDLAYQTACIRTFAGEVTTAISALRIALRHYPAAECRSRALALAALAQRQLDIGLVHSACATTRRLIDDHASLQSGRVTTALAGVVERLRPFRHLPTVQRLLNHTADLQHFQHGRPGRGLPATRRSAY